MALMALSSILLPFGKCTWTAFDPCFEESTVAHLPEVSPTVFKVGYSPLRSNTLYTYTFL